MQAPALSLLVALTLTVGVSAQTEAQGWIDVSVPVEEGVTPVYRGDPPIHFSYALDMAKGDVASVSRLEMGAHTGTHVDAPSHFVKDGKPVDQVPLGPLMGEALVIECSPSAKVIDSAELSRHPWKGAKRILFKTHSSYANLYSKSEFQTDFTGIAPDAAQQLVDGGVELVGMDYQSVEPFGSKVPRTHQILLGHPVVVVEGLDLRNIKGGRYDFICLPLRLKGREAAPARALLRPRP
jgi:arylformamidase